MDFFCTTKYFTQNKQMQELYIPRKHYLQTKKDIANCPDCDTLLVKEDCVIMLYGKSDIDEGEFTSNMSSSHFCHNCPVVIFEEETIEHLIKLALKMEDYFSYGILGLIDFDAVPEEKRHLELGTDENPLPIIEFLPNPNNRIKPKPIQAKLAKKVSKNAPCPCGSGKKHKRCCM